MNTLLIVILAFFIITTIVYVVKTTNLKADLKNKFSLLDSQQLSLKEKREQIEILKEDIKRRNARLDDYAQRLSALHTNLIQKLIYKTLEGEIAHNVKVKTIQDEKGNVIGYNATIRRKKDGKYQDIPVMASLQHPI